jgi:hypothetical protein
MSERTRAPAQSRLGVTPPLSTLAAPDGQQPALETLGRFGASTQFKLAVDDEEDIAFIGRCLASVESSPDPSSADFSRSEGRWTALSVYETLKGNIVCYEERKSSLPGERSKCKANVILNIQVAHVGEYHRGGFLTSRREERPKVSENMHSEVRAFFGQGWLAKRLYDAAGIENARHID